MMHDPENPDEEILEWLRAEIKKMLDEEFAKKPWWCLKCGDGGNYEGERPDQYWFPPEDHVCKETSGEPQGIFTGFTTSKDLPFGDLRGTRYMCPFCEHYMDEHEGWVATHTEGNPGCDQCVACRLKIWEAKQTT